MIVIGAVEFIFFADTVEYFDLVQFAHRKVERMPVRQVAAVREVHAEDGVAQVEHAGEVGSP